MIINLGGAPIPRQSERGTVITIGGPWHQGHSTVAGALRVQASFNRLPLASSSMGEAWFDLRLAQRSLTEIPMALAELHRVLQMGIAGYLLLPSNDDPVPYWPTGLLRRIIAGAGFECGDIATSQPTAASSDMVVAIRKSWTLPDYVAANMKVLICGLNPSPSSADSGVGFFKAGNRFWPAAIKAGLVDRDRDPAHALAAHGVGMTDMVKRPTRRADELDKAEYRAGLDRLTELVAWLQPRVICMVGLAGWRAAVSRQAQRGWQPQDIAGRPVYLMPSTSGLNAHDTVDTLAQHLAAASAGR